MFYNGHPGLQSDYMSPAYSDQSSVYSNPSNTIQGSFPFYPTKPPTAAASMSSDHLRQSAQSFQVQHSQASLGYVTPFGPVSDLPLARFNGSQPRPSGSLQEHSRGLSTTNEYTNFMTDRRVDPRAFPTSQPFDPFYKRGSSSSYRSRSSVDSGELSSKSFDPFNRRGSRSHEINATSPQSLQMAASASEAEGPGMPFSRPSLSNSRASSLQTVPQLQALMTSSHKLLAEQPAANPIGLDASNLVQNDLEPLSTLFLTGFPDDFTVRLICQQKLEPL